MKTTLTLVGVLLASAAFGQFKFNEGFVAFHNDSASAVTNALTGDKAAAGGAFLAALYCAPNATNAPDPAAFVSVGTPIAIDPPGYILGPNLRTPATNVIAHHYGGWFQVRVWEAAYGTTYEEAIAAPAMNGRSALRGASTSLNVRPGGDNPYWFPGSLTEAGLRGIVLETGTPQLQITRVGPNAVISWLSTSSTFRLEQSSSLPAAAGSWTTVPNAPVVNGHEQTVTVNATAPSRFYRLVSP